MSSRVTSGSTCVPKLTTTPTPSSCTGASTNSRRSMARVGLAPRSLGMVSKKKVMGHGTSFTRQAMLGHASGSSTESIASSVCRTSTSIARHANVCLWTLPCWILKVHETACSRAQGAPVRQRALFELARLFDDELDAAELAREVLVDTSPGTDEDRAILVLVNSARQSWSEKLEAWRARYSEQALANAANCHDPIAWERPPDMEQRFRDALNTLPRTKGLRLRT